MGHAPGLTADLHDDRRRQAVVAIAYAGERYADGNPSATMTLTMADSIIPAAPAYMIYASWRGQETDLASRQAKFNPPNSAAIINGSEPMQPLD